MIIPYEVDVPMSRWPYTNFALIGITIISFLLQFSLNEEQLMSYVLYGWSVKGMICHMFLHGGWMHLIGNMIFLWVFGNAVCAKVGNGIYLVIYLALGLTAAAGHNIFQGGAAVGASGVINGIVGLFLILYPLNNISCIILFGFRGGSFTLSSFWMILFWLAFDIWGAQTGVGNTAYFAHLGGFVGGFGLGVAMLLFGIIKMDRDEKSLLQVFGWNPDRIHEELEPESEYTPPIPEASSQSSGHQSNPEKKNISVSSAAVIHLSVRPFL